MKIFAHRGFYGTTDINQAYLARDDVKGQKLKDLPPENTEESVVEAFKRGFNVEIDVVMTKDRELVVTHTNELALHSKDAKPNDFLSDKNLSEVLKMKTGLGGKTAPYLLYSRFLEILKEYPNLQANVEIKGNIHPSLVMNELGSPTLVEKLVEKTPDELFEQIIWSSFSISHLIEMRNLKPNADVAMLFYMQKNEETRIYTDKGDLFMQFNRRNLENVLNQLPNLNAVHPNIETLDDEEAVEFCVERNITIRPWVFNEKNPEKDAHANQMILKVMGLQGKYKTDEFGIITDFSEEVRYLLEN